MNREATKRGHMETGIPKMDDPLGGGIPRGKSLVYCIMPGIDGGIFGLQTIYATLKKDGSGVYVLSETTPDIIKARFKEFGWDIDSFTNRLILVDAYSPLSGVPSKEKYVISNPDNIEEFSKTIRQMLNESPPSTIVFESLSIIMDLCGENETIEAVKVWNRIAQENGHIIVYNFIAGPYSNETLDKIKNDLFNAVISIGGITERVLSGQYFKITKADWIKEIKKSIFYRILRPGGIKILIPRILVIGPPFDAKMSDFVRTHFTRAKSVDKLDTTIAMYHGNVDYIGFSPDIFGAPNLERLIPIMKLLRGEFICVFIFVDSINPDNSIHAEEILEMTKSCEFPYIIVAKKQDSPRALALDEIRKKLRLPEDALIVPALEKDEKGVVETFELMINNNTGKILWMILRRKN
jgi:KaiC/GvpD/RAD55 family RecA-like ATPase/signal recognition particle receptor subunit beta